VTDIDKFRKTNMLSYLLKWGDSMEENQQEPLKLPKNIRQIGEKEDMVKVYFEDYANTYLKKIRPQSGQGLKIGLLLGHSVISQGIPYLFINGAMEMENIDATPEEITFTNEVWTDAYETVDKFFSGYTIQGWFICGSLEVKLDPLELWNLHSKYFPGKNQLLYLNPTHEVDESLYITSVNGFYKMNGHYIFYERNQAMQDYMILRKEVRQTEPGVDNRVVNTFRTVMGDKKKETNQSKTVNLLYSVCTFLTLVICAIGVTMLNTHDKMKSMETALLQLSANAAEIVSNEVESSKEAESFSEGISEEGVIIDEIPGNVFPTTEAETTQTEEAAASVEETSAEEEISAEEETTMEEPMPENTETETAVAEAAGNEKIHIVKEGETLYSISLTYYHTITMVEQICELNEIEDQDKIVVDQQLQLP